MASLGCVCAEDGAAIRICRWVSVLFWSAHMLFQRFDFGDGHQVPVRIHDNGGGVIALTAHVDPTVFVGAGCKVWGHAKLYGRVRLVGRVLVFGHNLPGDVSVQIEDDAVIVGSVQISGAVLIRDRTEIRDNAKLSGCVQAMHRVRICGNTVLDGDVLVKESAYLTGNTRIISFGRRTVVQGEHYMNGQNIEYTRTSDSPRKLRASALRPAVFDTLVA